MYIISSNSGFTDLNFYLYLIKALSTRLYNEVFIYYLNLFQVDLYSNKNGWKRK